MSVFLSMIGPYIEGLFDYRKSLGYKERTHYHTLSNFDRFCAMNFPESTVLTKEMVHAWLDLKKSGFYEKCISVRLLGKYMDAVGAEAYILPEKYVTQRHDFSPYVFTDEELARLFRSIDHVPASKSEPFIQDIAPVLFRLIYTCGLRPNEGRELMTENVHLDTGELLITNTKKKKDRMVVMSGDMCSLMRSYDQKRAVIGAGNEYWFPSAKGGSLPSAFVTSLFQESWRRANPGIPDELIPRVRVYDLRHRFASAALIRWLDNGDSLKAKLPYLRAYMGHSSLQETSVYIHILPENLTQTTAIDWDGFYDVIPEVQ